MIEMKVIGSLCKQKHVDSALFKDICENHFKHEVRCHRKLWEFIWIYHILDSKGMLTSGKSGIGFGCGTEPLVPAFVIRGNEVLVTDLEIEEAKRKGWAHPTLHVDNIESFSAYIPSICDKKTFQQKVKYRVVDMNYIPGDLLRGCYDFTWSSCSLEHLGNLDLGREFILNSLKTLKPGGIAVHTTEYNVSSNLDTLESGSTCIYRKQDIMKILNQAKGLGYNVCAVDFDTGNLVNDNHIDLPPYTIDKHLKTHFAGYTVTSIGIFIEKPLVWKSLI